MAGTWCRGRCSNHMNQFLSIDCLDGFRFGDDLGCYKIYLEKRTWQDAKSSCERDYSGLISLETIKETQALKTKLGETSSKYLCTKVFKTISTGGGGVNLLRFVTIFSQCSQSSKHLLPIIYNFVNWRWHRRENKGPYSDKMYVCVALILPSDS